MTKSLNKAIMYLLICTLVFAQFLNFTVVEAATLFSITPEAVSSSNLPKRITVTSTESSFTKDNSTPYIMQSGQVVQSATVSNVTNTTSQVEFTLAGISDGTYDIRIVDPKGTYNVGEIVIADPIITNITPSSIEKNYSSQSMIVTGSKTNFETGKTSVEILDSNSDVVDYVESITSIDSTESLTFRLKNSLPSGTYSLRFSTDDEVVLKSNILTVRGVPRVTLSPNSLSEGYPKTTISVEGTNTGFEDLKTSVSIIGQDKVGTVTVIDEDVLTFSLISGLATGTYTVNISTNNEEVETSLVIKDATASVKYQGSNLDEIPAGYTSPYNLVLDGSNTSFATGSTDFRLYNGDPESDGEDITSTYVSNTSIDEENQSISFKLGTGLTADTYYLRVVTGNQVVTDTFQIVSPSINTAVFNADIADSNSLPEGYKALTINITGENTLFTQGNTTVVIQDQDSMTETIIVEDSTHLSFKLKEDLSEGSYTIVIDGDGDSETTSDKITYGFTVTSPIITSVSPDHIVNASSTPIIMTVNAEGTHFTSSTPKIDITGCDDETISSNITVINDTKLTFILTPNSIADSGNYGLSITTTSNTISETVTGSNLITVDSSGISSVYPSTIYEDELGSATVNINGVNTNFVSGNTTVLVGDTLIGANDVTVVSTTQLQMTAPADLEEGVNAITVTDADSNEYQSSIVIATRSISLNTTSKNYEYSSFEMIVNGRGVTFDTTDNKPSVSISGHGAVTVDNEDITTDSFTFTFPTGLDAGTYTVTATINDLVLTDTFTVNNITSNIFFKYDNVSATSVSVDIDEETINIQAYAELIAGGNAEITTKANWSVISGSDVVSISNGTITLKSAGNATVRASYDDVVSTINIEVTGEEVETPGSGGHIPIVIPEVEETVNLGDIKVIKEDTVFEDGTEGIMITLDEESTIETIKNADFNNFIVELDKGTNNAAIKISSNIIESLKEKEENSTITVKSDTAEYILPVEVIDVEKIKTSLGEEEITIDIVVKETSGEINNKINELATEQNIEILATPIEFKIEASAGNSKVEINNFKTKYVSRNMTLTKAVNVKTAVGVLYDEETNTYIHVPTKFYQDSETGKLIAQIKRKGNSIYTVIESKKTFTDITNNWAKDSIKTLSSKLIINGVSESKFAPNDKVTRAQFAAFLVRALGLTTNTHTASNFSDVDETKWYFKAVNKAANEGLVDGCDDKIFKPNKTITREEMAAMVTNALKVAENNSKVNPLEKSILLSKFDDERDISDWSRTSVAIAVKQGIINGKTDNTFGPKDDATRAEAATMLLRMMQAVEFTN